MLISQPVKLGGAAPLRHQLHLRGMHPAQSIAIDDGEDLPWVSVRRSGESALPCR